MICSHTWVVPNLWLICNLKTTKDGFASFSLRCSKNLGRRLPWNPKKMMGFHNRISSTGLILQVKHAKLSGCIWNFPGPPPVISWRFKRPIYSWIQLPRRNFHATPKGERMTLPKFHQPFQEKPQVVFLLYISTFSGDLDFYGDILKNASALA